MKKIFLIITIILVSIGSIYLYAEKRQDIQSEINNKLENNKTTKKQMGTVNLTKADFLEKVVDYENNPTEWKYLGDKPCIIDFYADWCGPCKMVAPILEELAVEYGDDIYIYKVDTESEQELAAAFGIRSIPSILFVPMDEAPQMAAGALPKHALKDAIHNVLLKDKTKEN